MRFPSSARRRAPSLGQSVTLGLVHGPAELLPVSSSGHIAVLPWLLGWNYPELDPELRKAFEVALHAGTAAGLAVTSRKQLVRVDRQQLMLSAIAATPPALAGYLLRREIERRLGTPRAVAAGLAIGAVVMLLADRAPEARTSADAVPSDGVWLGVAQACALAPGISRSGATLSAARLRGFTRSAAVQLSDQVGLPVVAGAVALELTVLGRRPLGEGWAAALQAGAGAAFASTLAAARLMGLGVGRPLTRWAIYRLGLAAVILARPQSGRRP